MRFGVLARTHAALVVAGLLGVGLLVGCDRAPVTTTPATTLAPAPARVCRLEPGDANASCGHGTSRLENEVYAAIDTLVAAQPQLFDTKDESGGAGTRQYRVLDREAYLDGVVAVLLASGACAQRDPDDASYEHIQVKTDAAFSETFDVLFGSGYVHRTGMYRETCTPASFPVDREGLPAPGSGCGKPYPPPVARIALKVHFPGGDYDLLDSTPIVGPDVRYCAQIGFTDERSFCPVRPDGSPERSPCEAWRMGKARDTGRPGPTWTRNGQLCTGGASGCLNHDQNQYSLLAFASGTYQACAESGVCGTLQVKR